MQDQTHLGTRTARAALAALFGAMLAGCFESDRLGYDFNFAQGTHGWTPDFADYPPANKPDYQLGADYRPLPAPLDAGRSALFITGKNLSDDLFMYYKAQVGLRPNTQYRVSFDVEIATPVPGGCVGVGGAPGEDVWVKAGVSSVEPQGLLDDLGYLRMNVDTGSQSSSGENALVVGDMANSRDCEDGPGWELKQLSGGPLEVISDEAGSAWLFVGTDSGFEARTEVYYTRFLARFDPD